MTHLVDGRTIAVTMATATAAAAVVLRGAGITPTLAMLVPTDDAGAAWYVRAIQRAAWPGRNRQPGPPHGRDSQRGADRGPPGGTVPGPGGARRHLPDPAAARSCSPRRGRVDPGRQGRQRRQPGLAGRAGGRAPGRLRPGHRRRRAGHPAARTGPAEGSPRGRGWPVHGGGQASRAAAARRERHGHRRAFADSGPPGRLPGGGHPGRGEQASRT